MRLLIPLLVIAGLVVIVLSSFGSSPGFNKFRILVEVLIIATAITALLTFRQTGTRRVAFGGVSLVSLLTVVLVAAPGLEYLRRNLLAGATVEQGRGFVLALIGRPELVSDGVGTSEVYGYRAGGGASVLVLHFRRSTSNEDEVMAYAWMEEDQARSAYALHPPGSP